MKNTGNQVLKHRKLGANTHSRNDYVKFKRYATTITQKIKLKSLLK